jgi:predicted GNAT family N-acyltransferase
MAEKSVSFDSDLFQSITPFYYYCLVNASIQSSNKTPSLWTDRQWPLPLISFQKDYSLFRTGFRSCFYNNVQNLMEFGEETLIRIEEEMKDVNWILSISDSQIDIQSRVRMMAGKEKYFHQIIEGVEEFCAMKISSLTTRTFPSIPMHLTYTISAPDSPTPVTCTVHLTKLEGEHARGVVKTIFQANELPLEDLHEPLQSTYCELSSLSLPPPPSQTSSASLMVSVNPTSVLSYHIFSYVTDTFEVISTASVLIATLQTTNQTNNSTPNTFMGEVTTIPIASIYEVATIPQHQKKGLASNLINYILQWAQQEYGCTIAVLSASQKGRGIYEKLGFEVCLGSFSVFVREK